MQLRPTLFLSLIVIGAGLVAALWSGRSQLSTADAGVPLAAPADSRSRGVSSEIVAATPPADPVEAADRESAAPEERAFVDAPTTEALASGSPQSVVVTLQRGHKVTSLAGAIVEIVPAGVSAVDGDVEAPLSTITIDQSGECRAEWPNGAPGDSLIARVAKSGWCQVRTKLRLDEATQTWKGRLKVSQGVTVRGRLLAPSGEGVPGKIRLMGRFTSENLGGGVSERSDEEGGFVLHSFDYLFGPNTGRTPVLFAECEGVGTAMIPAFDLSQHGSAPGKAEPLVVQLQGSGVLRGQLVDSSGVGVAAATLVARTVSSGAPGTPRAPYSELLDGEGFRRARTVTQQDGTFELRGLRTDEFWIASVAPTLPWEEKGATLLTPRPVPSDGALLRLSQDRPALTVELLGSDGERWAGPVEVEESPSYAGHKRRWPESPALYVEERSPGASSGRLLMGRVSSDGLLVYPLSGERDAVVEIMGGKSGFDGFLPSRYELQWSDATAEGQLKLQIRATQLAPLGAIELDGTVTGRERSSGTLVLPPFPADALASFGEALPPAPVLERKPIIFLSGHTLEVSLLRPPASPILVLDSRTVPSAEAGVIALQLPEGRYRWRIAPRVYGDWSSLADSGGAEGVVDVVAGQASRVKCHIDAGSNVRVLVEGTESVRLGLERPDGTKFDLSRLLGAGGHTTAVWPAGEVHTSIIVASGSYDLVARFRESGIERRFTVELKPAACLDVLITRD